MAVARNRKNEEVKREKKRVKRNPCSQGGVRVTPGKSDTGTSWDMAKGDVIIIKVILMILSGEYNC